MPAWLAFSVIRLLEEHFARLVDLRVHRHAWRTCSTRSRPAAASAVAVLAEFYFGDGDGDVEGLKQLVTELGDIDARELATFPIGDGHRPAGRPLRALRRGHRRASRGNVPDDLPPDELTLEKAQELLANPAGAETSSAPTRRPAA